MRKKGENSVKCAGKSAFPPDENNDFTLGVESQSAHLADSLPDCSVEGAPAARTVPPALSFARAR
jgi:hypothetical protein